MVLPISYRKLPQNRNLKSSLIRVRVHLLLRSIEEKAKLCQKAEHTFAGMPCGIMDQLICLNGKAGNALLIDCRSLETELVPIVSEDCVFVVTNSNVKHELASSEYAARRRNCEQVATMLGKSSLRDVSMRELESSLPSLSQDLYRVARHVITEIERTANAAEALRRGDHSMFGTLMTQSHVSLRDDYQVSCAELDEIVEIALGTEGVLGARMTGGGFGGCVVTLVRVERAKLLLDNIESKYRKTATSYQFSAADGGRILELQL